MIEKGRPFFKMSGSGNDFVFVDVRRAGAGDLASPDSVRAVCDRRTGVGADGMVFLDQGGRNAVSIRYLNSDGSLAELCGNATLCSARLAMELGIVDGHDEFTIATDSGEVTARFCEGQPEIDLQPVVDVQGSFQADLELGEIRIGFALVGVPHLVVLCADVDKVPVVDRGRRLRHHARLAYGANVNFVSRHNDAWRVRTYERGVEAETLACGTGAVATGLLLAAWGASDATVELETRSGRLLRVRHRSMDGQHLASLSGEARIVFLGELGELFSRRT